MSSFINKALKEISHQNKEANAEQEKKAKREFWKDIALIGVSIITATFIGLQVYYSYKSFRFENRAYLLASPNFSIVEQMSDNTGHFRVSVNIKNHGRTPPQYVKTVAYLVLADSTYVLHQTDGDTLKHDKSAGLNGIIFIYRKRPFPEAKNIEDCILTFYLNGEITYRDIFDIRHATEFCFRYNWEKQYFEEYGNCNKSD